MSGALAGRSAVITGGSQGFGLAVARAFVGAGANVLICAREAELLRRAEDELHALASSSQKVAVAQCDVTSEDEVRQLVERALLLFGQVQVLVNNAGVHGGIGRVEDVDWREWVRALDVNLLGSVLPCRALLPHMRQNRHGKIVQLSGGGATQPRPHFSAYAASKAAVVRFAETLAEETRGSGIDVNAIAPGALNTRLLDDILAAGPERVGAEAYNSALTQKREGGASFERGAALAVYLASSASDGISGKLLSAVWDPWDSLHEHADDLRGDVYTLRRIVPGDRGMDWGDR